MKESEYRLIKAVRNSGLGTIVQRSPAHYLHELRADEKKTPALSFGSYVHALILTPEIAERDYRVFDESQRPNPEKPYTDTANRAWKLAIQKQAEIEEVQLVSLDDHRRALACRDAIARNGLANEVQNSMGVHERLVQWTDLDTGVMCKARIDRTRLDASKIVDLKTTDNASKRKFLRSIIDYGYHRQAAFYLDGSGAKRFTIIAVESSPPHGVAVYDLSDEFIELGRRAYKFALKQIESCRKRYGSEFDPETIWPSYDYYAPAGEVLSPPAWAASHDFSDY